MAVPAANELELRETTDFASMRRLALESGLEDGAYDDFAKAFGFYDGETLVACAALKVQGDVFSLECVAVRPELRRKGLGRRLIAALEEEAKRRGALRLWALARAPAFFEKAGYRRVASGVPGGPNLTSCMSCVQYHRDCDPSIVLKMLQRA